MDTSDCMMNGAFVDWEGKKNERGNTLTRHHAISFPSYRPRAFCFVFLFYAHKDFFFHSSGEVPSWCLIHTYVQNAAASHLHNLAFLLNIYRSGWSPCAIHPHIPSIFSCAPLFLLSFSTTWWTLLSLVPSERSFTVILGECWPYRTRTISWSNNFMHV